MMKQFKPKGIYYGVILYILHVLVYYTTGKKRHSGFQFLSLVYETTCTILKTLMVKFMHHATNVRNKKAVSALTSLHIDKSYSNSSGPLSTVHTHLLSYIDWKLRDKFAEEKMINSKSSKTNLIFAVGSLNPKGWDVNSSYVMYSK